MGICRLPGPSQHHRRLDIIVVPYAEFACALLYFTGSAHFNRSMRALAKTKHMSLSEHSLNCDVVRQRGVKLVAGRPLQTPTEKDVFKHLGIPYRDPCERDWWSCWILIWNIDCIFRGQALNEFCHKLQYFINAIAYFCETWYGSSWIYSERTCKVIG